MNAAIGEYFISVANSICPGNWRIDKRGFGGFYVTDGRKAQIGAAPLEPIDENNGGVLWQIWLIGRGFKTYGSMDKRKCDIRDHTSVLKAFEAVINDRM